MKKQIIHFTKSYSKLKSILLESSLRLKYCQEIFALGNQTISSAVHPMVCFSEYDTRELREKKITYGRYGIAFHDNWINHKGIHPVLYIDKNSVPANGLAQLLKARQNKEQVIPKNLRLPIMQLKCFVKNGIGPNKKMGIINFDFRGENEWRYVPSKKKIGGQLLSQNRSTYSLNRKKYNKKLLPFPLRFLENDILKIYVAKESEILSLVESTGLNQSIFSIRTWKYLDSQGLVS